MNQYERIGGVIISMRTFWYTGMVAILATGCSGPYANPTVAAKEDKPVSVAARAVRLEAIPEIITATGELFAEDVATISVKVPGRLRKINVDLGSTVQAGDAIAELEREDFEFRVRQAEAMVQQTRARLGLGDGENDEVNPESTAVVKQADASMREARFVYETTTQLFRQGVVSKIDFEKAGIALQGAEARRQQAVEEVLQMRAELIERRANLALARQQLQDTVVRAPFAGSVTQRRATIGEYLPVNAPVAELVRDNPMRIRLEVPERLAPKVQIGQRIDLRLEGPMGKHSGRVARLSPSLEAQNRSLRIEGQIGNEDGSLRSGSFVEATITVNPNAQGVAVPRLAVRSFAGVDRVLVVDGDVLAERVVKVGRSLDDDRVEIVSGLDAGTLLVTSPDSRLKPAQKVSVQGS